MTDRQRIAWKNSCEDFATIAKRIQSISMPENTKRSVLEKIKTDARAEQRILWKIFMDVDYDWNQEVEN